MKITVSENNIVTENEFSQVDISQFYDSDSESANSTDSGILILTPNEQAL